MSTKALRALLECVRTGLRPRDEMVADALSEVEAIERAARNIAVDGHGKVGDNPQYKAWSDAMSLLESIAKDAP